MRGIGRRTLVLSGFWAGVCSTVTAPVRAADAASSPLADDPAAYVSFTQEFVSLCVERNGVQLLVRSTHPTRTVRVWLDRYHMGGFTGDRSRTDLPPGGEPSPLGCSHTDTGPQEWRIVRATFLN